MERLALWWRRNVVGGLHDHEEGNERADCNGCRDEEELLPSSTPGTLRGRVSGPTDTSGPRPEEQRPEEQRPEEQRPEPEPAAGRRSAENASSGVAGR